MVWLSNWANRIKIRISGQKVGENLTNFPILIYLSSISGLNARNLTFIFDELGSNYKRIAVTKDDGLTQLYVEVEKWDSVNEKAWLWVKVPSISATVDTVLYLYYDSTQPDNTTYVGDPNSTPAENVWESSAKLVTHMKDDPDTSHIRDSTGNNNDGTKVAVNEPIETDGKVSKAQNFDGTNDYVQAADADNLDITTAITIATWVKPLTGIGNEPNIILKGNAYCVAPQSLQVLFAYKSGGIWRYSYGAASTLTLDVWQHLVVTYVSGALKIYINGVVGFTSSSLTGAIDITTQNLNIGHKTGLGNLQGDAFKGPIDEVRIYNEVKSASWIKADYETQRDQILTYFIEGETFDLERGLVLRLPFEEGSGIKTFDRSKRQNNGIINGASWTTNGKIGNALDFDGTNDELSINDADSLDLLSAFSISEWIKIENLPTTDYHSILFKNEHYRLRINRSADGNYIEGAVYLAGSWGTSVASVAVPFIATWIFVTLTWDGITLKLYINALFNDSEGRSGSIVATINNLFVGSENATNYFDGIIDEVRLYNRVLSPEEIMTLYNEHVSLYSLDAGLVGHWSMDEYDGLTVYDKTGKGNNGTINGGAKRVVGKIKNAINFDGVDDKVTVPDSDSLDIVTAITMALWVRSDINYGAWAIAGLIHKDDNSGNPKYGVAIENNGFYLTIAGQEAYHDFGATWAGVWHHLVATYDSTTGTVKLYRDGIEVSVTGSISGTIPITAYLLYIGSWQLVPNRYFDGIIDEVRVYNRALTAGEIRALYNKEAGLKTLALYLPMNEGNGITTYDQSPYQNHGTLTGPTHLPTWTDGKIGKAVDFDGIDDKILVPHSDSLNLSQTITLEAWIKADNINRIGGIIWKGIYGAAIEATYRLNSYTPSGKVQFGLGFTTAGFKSITSEALSNGVWYHIVGTYDGATMRLYINGVPDGTPVSVVDTFGTNTQSLTIGRIATGAELFDGIIDEVRIYNRALTPQEILKLYNDKIGGMS